MGPSDDSRTGGPLEGSGWSAVDVANRPRTECTGFVFDAVVVPTQMGEVPVLRGATILPGHGVIEVRRSRGASAAREPAGFVTEPQSSAQPFRHGMSFASVLKYDPRSTIREDATP